MKSIVCTAAAMAAFLSFVPVVAPAHAETTLCTEITALPFTITVQGVYCLKQNLNVNLATGNAITINAGNVTIDFNGWRVNNQAAASNGSRGLFALNRKHVSLRNGFIRGFFRGIDVVESVPDASASHLVEGMKIADSRDRGISVAGDQSIIRDNKVFNSGGGPASSAHGILMEYADDGLVADNVISGVTATVSSHGIFIDDSARVQVTGNKITVVDGGSNFDAGIAVVNVYQAIIAGNRLLNDPTTGSGAVLFFNDADNIVCLDNTIGGFGASPLTGCNVSDGNRLLFN